MAACAYQPRTAARFLRVHVTLKTKPPYSNWQVEDRAKESDMLCKDILPFPHREFPGYEHQTTDPQAKVFEPQFSRTYIFVHSPVRCV